MSKAARAPAATFVVFGGTGDLTRRLLAPALVNLSRDGLLDDATRLIGIGRSGGSDGEFRDSLSEFVDDKDDFAWLRERVTYMEGDFTGDALFDQLKTADLKDAVFYLATAASFFGPIVEKLAETGLLDEKAGFRRVVIEKPFGSDLASAHALNEQILTRIGEPQIYRIDHFLGKETVQNIMVLRFGNPAFEAVWNSRYIDHVQITAAEAVGVGSRGKFYDATGALRDMVPNHLFQVMSMIGMEAPNSFDAEAIRTEKAKVVAAACPVTPEDAVRGRYAAGEVGGKPMDAYLKTADIAADSTTETYAALKVEVQTWRWAGTPFYLRTGKALGARDTEVVIQFRDVPVALLKDADMQRLPPNRLVLQIQPDEGVRWEVVAKIPGPQLEAAPVSLDFRYADAFEMGHRTGYETLLYDVLTGDQMLFQRADQIEAGWRAVQPLIDAWSKAGAPEDYPAGSAGPSDAEALLIRDGRRWHALG